MSKGRHLILDLYGCSPDILNNYEELECLLETALSMAGATILRIFGEKFEPQGVTLLALLAESHASVHTWPELGYCAIDLYTCGEATSTDKAAEFLTYKLGSTNQVKKDLVRDPKGNDAQCLVRLV
jgi:S-adenosylmethionine decarboxylase